MNSTDIDKIAASARVKLNAGDAKAAFLMTNQVLQTGNATVALLEVHAHAANMVGNYDSAIFSIQKLIQSAGATVDRAVFYGNLFLQKKEWQKAADVFQQIINDQNGVAIAWIGLGLALQGAGDIPRATQCYQGAVERDPANLDAKFRLGSTLLFMGEAMKAATLLSEAYEGRKNSAEVAFYFAESLRRSVATHRAVTILEPFTDDPEWGDRVERCLVMCLLSTEAFERAEVLLEKKLAETPDDVELLACKSRLLMIDGRRQEALELMEQVLLRADATQVSWEGYAELLDEPMPPRMLEKLMHHREAVVKLNQKNLIAGSHFAAYKHYSLVGDLGNEIAELNQANAMMAEILHFHPVRHTENVRQVRESYPRKRIDALEAEHQGFDSVHILCPPRSGSTLLEQALARHSRFWAAGEKNFAGEAWKRLSGEYSMATRPDLHAEISPEQVRQFAVDYIQAAKDAGWDGSQWMVQKSINSHKFAGLLRAAFPRARFIDLRRQPMDVAFGCYRQNFESQPFSFTAEGIASEIALFQDNMVWWHQQMPEAMLGVSYEALVADFESELRRILGWLGEDWEEGCVDFGRKSRVATASATQVREGLFTKGIGRWEKYGDLLNPLKDALQQKGLI